MKKNKIGIILLVISLIIICIGCYLKSKDNLGNVKSSKISLDDIAKQYNNMDDLKTLKSTGASSKATVSKDTIIISYNNTKKTYKIVFKYKNGILTNEYKNNELNVIVSSIIYPNLLEAIAILDGYDEIEIGETVSQILNNKHKSDGYEMYFKNDTLYFKVDLSKKLKLYKSSKIYDEATGQVTTIDLGNTNFSDIKYFKIKKEKTYE